MANILVIDDDKVVAGMISAFLTSGGHAVRIATDGKMGMESIAAHPTDLAVMDMFMPEKDGLEVIRELRALRPDFPVIAISGGGTAAGGADILNIARILGAKAVLTKPVLKAELLAAVEKCLGPRTV